MPALPSRPASAVVLVLLLGVARLAAGQGSQPLRKTDVIRLLSNPLISRSEVAELIRRNCIAFRPTPRDWADLRDFGADSQVLSSIGGCATTPTGGVGGSGAGSGAGGPVGTAEPRSPAQLPMSAVLLPPRLSVTVGGTALARVQIKRGEVPLGGIPLVLRGGAAIPGGPLGDLAAMTDPGGVAVFRFPVGRVPATYQLALVTGSGLSIPGTPSLEIVVGPGGPAVAAVEPGRVDVRGGERGPATIVVTVRDSLGNALTGEPVALQPDSPDLGVTADVRPTDSVGRATFVVERAAVRHGGRLTFRVRGQVMSVVDVVRTDAVAPAATGFVSGVGQRGIARTRLGEPLVFQARSSLGRPLAGKAVTFRAVNAEVAQDSVVTDSAGVARVDVTLGKQAGPALVTATVDSLQRQAALIVDPAAPVGVVIERDGTRVDGGSMVVPAGATFVVRVSAQDAYGNPVATADLGRLIQKTRTRFNLQSQLLRMISVESDAGTAMVTFKSVGTGQADLTIAGATVSVAIVPSR
jgi:hypothetical protein